MKKKTLPSLRISERTFDKMNLALEKLNEKNLIPMSRNDFVRLSIENFSNSVMQDKDMVKLQM